MKRTRARKSIQPRRRMLMVVCVMTAGVVSLLGTSNAVACGGLFCAQAPPTPAAPAPVDQTAERILFEVGDGEITAHVQIQYTGSADEFAWVVPVPAVPEVDDSSSAVFDDVDSVTQLQVIMPPAEPCAFSTGNDGGGGGGCIGCADDEAVGADNRGLENQNQPNSPVIVYNSGVTDNYEFSTVGAESTQDLVDWLQDNGYNVSDNMTPVMDVYNGPGAMFLAIKLREGRSASDIVPIQFTYEGSQPSIPIRLTAVAAQPLMGILVFILADQPYVPANWMMVLPDADELLFDRNSRVNYFEWVARQADEADGQFWSTEYIGNYVSPTGSAQIASRYYTRISPEQMTLDPVFSADPTNTVVSNIIDLSSRTTLYQCNTVATDREPSLCAFNYCGLDAECAVVNGRVGCFCAAGDVAQQVTGPDGSLTVTCVPETNQFGITAEASGAGTAFDPCNDVDCGQGSCVLKSGFPTCECDSGALACLEDTGIVCLEVPADTVTFGPGAGIESQGAIVAARPVVQRGTAFAISPWIPMVLGLGLLASLGRRSRRRSR